MPVPALLAENDNTPDHARRSWKQRSPAITLKARVGVRFADEERTLLQSRADEAQVSLSDYIRCAVLGRRLNLPKKQRTELLYELNRIGNNINQLTMYAHMEQTARLENGSLAQALSELQSVMRLVASEYGDELG